MSGHRGHLPVMLAEVLATLAPRDGAAYLDGTFGGGGYAGAILDAAPGCTLFAIDRDPDAIARGAALAARFPGRLHLLRWPLRRHAVACWRSRASPRSTAWCSTSASPPSRSTSPSGVFRSGSTARLTCVWGRPANPLQDLVNSLPESELADLLFDLGEERHARRIARAIVAARREAPIATTGRLAEIVRAAAPRDPSGLDRATRSFQALRIAVNDELGEVERGLAGRRAAAGAGRPAGGGRLPFARGPDREALHGRAPPAAAPAPPATIPPPSGRPSPGAAALCRDRRRGFRLLTPRALRPSAAETEANPRARSARLRAIERLAPQDAAA